MTTPRGRKTPTTSEVRRLSDLLEVSRSLGATLNFNSALNQVLELLAEHHEALSGIVALRDDEQGDLRVTAAQGASASAAQRARYRLGEGITGRVVQTGRPVVVPQVSREPMFLDRSGFFKASRKTEMSYLCVPITLDDRTAGALGVALPHRAQRDYEQEIKFLGVVGSMIGQALKVHRLIEAKSQRLVEENKKLKQELRQRYDLRNMVGHSRRMQDVYDQVGQVAGAATTVLLRGESGTGKELVAHAIHYNSPRAAGPFVKVSCGALPESLIESELFGYEPGAFTDARTSKKGRFELADSGTLFLDEVGELSAPTQVKLLRVLQEREFERLGGTKSIKVNVRLVAATNADLEQAVRAGTFRADLFYRLDVFNIFLPPLRERRTDIPLLADHFVEKYAGLAGKEVRRVATSAIDMLMSYHWPGNVRELENAIERAVLVCDGGVIHAHHLPPTLQTAEVSGTLPRRSLAQAIESYEKDMILDALKSARGNRAQAARLLDTTERIIGYKVQRLGIEASRFKGEPAAGRRRAE